MHDYDELLDLLISLRKSGGDSQASLARKLGVVPSTVGNWESRVNKVPFNACVKWLGLYGHALRVLPATLASTLFAESDDSTTNVLVRLTGILATLDESALLDVEAIATRLAPREARQPA